MPFLKLHSMKQILMMCLDNTVSVALKGHCKILYVLPMPITRSICTLLLETTEAWMGVVSGLALLFFKGSNYDSPLRIFRHATTHSLSQNMYAKMLNLLGRHVSNAYHWPNCSQNLTKAIVFKQMPSKSKHYILPAIILEVTCSRCPLVSILKTLWTHERDKTWLFTCAHSKEEKN
jgi:ABC-type dipeptide/oligopeptide/nickel transport system permease component